MASEDALQISSVPQEVAAPQVTQCGGCDQGDHGGRAAALNPAAPRGEERGASLQVLEAADGGSEPVGWEPPPAGATGQQLALLDAVRLTPLMARSSGRPDLVIALLDGPVAARHPDLADARIQDASAKHPAACIQTESNACAHGTFVAGILSARRGSAAPAICPDCTLLVRPIFQDAGGGMPSATPEELGEAIVECVEAGASVINLSVGFAQPSTRSERALGLALDHAMRRGVVVVAAAGNQGTLGSSSITRHPWVIPVVACDVQGRPTGLSNLGHAISRHGLSAPGIGVVSLGIDGGPMKSDGTSTAAPFVAGAVSLIWSLFPSASAAEVKRAVTDTEAPLRRRLIPPMLDAWTAYQGMARKLR